MSETALPRQPTVRGSLWTVAGRSLKYFARPHLALAAGIAAATAVIVGALVVGDSVRGSLRKLVVDRLGRIECTLQARTFFDPAMFDTTQLADGQGAVVPGIVFPTTTVEYRTDGALTRAANVQVLAYDREFWQVHGIDSAPEGPQLDEVVLNRSLADELGVAEGDEISLRVNPSARVSGDSPLGKRDDNSINVPRQKVVAILEDTGIGGLSFLAGQSAPRNVFANLATLQDMLECGTQVNAAVVLARSSSNAADSTESSISQGWCDELNLQLRPKLEDYGLVLAHHRRVFPDPEIDQPAIEGLPPQVVFDYYQLSSGALVLDEATSRAVVLHIGRERAVRHLTYLANFMAKVNPTRYDLAPSRSAQAYERRTRDDLAEAEQGSRPSMVGVSIGEDDPANRRPVATIGRELTELSESSLAASIDRPRTEFLSRQVPYSIVVGIDRHSELAFEDYLQVPREDLRVPYCWINEWLARELDVQAGDWFQAVYFEPETVDGREVETSMRMMVAGVVPVQEPIKEFRRNRPPVYDTAPSRFNDPDLTPSVPGVTDQNSIANWDVPFTLDDDKILDVDDQYWNNHHLTPKVFLPFQYASSPRMFGSRFGNTTAIRFEADKIEDEATLRAEIEEALLPTRGAQGLHFMPLRQRQLQAAAGTTPFDMLFLSLSFFVIVAALLLVLLLFKLGIQQRTSELGILLAQGFTPNRVRSLLLREMVLVGLVGAGAGILLGIGYARMIVAGLESWWIGAIATRFLTFFVSWPSLIIGAAGGFVASLLAIWWGLRKLGQVNALGILRGNLRDESTTPKRANRLVLAFTGFVGIGACGLMVSGFGQSGMARAGTFFGSGMLLLGAALVAIHQLLEGAASVRHDPKHGNLASLAVRGLCRNPLRSSLSLSLLAVASFLIASMGVFQISPSEKGYGGFNLLAQSSRPIYRNIGSSSVRSEALGDEAKQLIGTTIVSMRARQGEDASCNNLFQVAQPTILGVSERLRELHDFAPDSVDFSWAATNDDSNPWSALSKAATGEQMSPIPVILDQNTAAWSLKQGASLNAIIRLEIEDRPIYFRTVGLLSNSVLQGKLLIGQSNFENLFPKLSGYSFFLIRSDANKDPQLIAQTLEKGWANEGLDVTYSSEVLANYLGVQNTYISAFQSLGALGLLLGTFGLIAVQVRSVWERRSELALMRAVGFAPGRLASMLTVETIMLLGGGMLIGVLCSIVALVPYVIEVGPQLSLFNSTFMLIGVVLVGIVASLISVRAASRIPVVEALRSQ